jgi:hypothetical protein
MDTTQREGKMKSVEDVANKLLEEGFIPEPFLTRIAVHVQKLLIEARINAIEHYLGYNKNVHPIVRRDAQTQIAELQTLLQQTGDKNDRP